MVVTHAGTKPGHPLADLIFCIAFFQYQQELQHALWDEGLLLLLPRSGPFLLEPRDDFVKSMPFGTPTFFDDSLLRWSLIPLLGFWRTFRRLSPA